VITYYLVSPGGTVAAKGSTPDTTGTSRGTVTLTTADPVVGTWEIDVELGLVIRYASLRARIPAGQGERQETGPESDRDSIRIPLMGAHYSSSVTWQPIVARGVWMLEAALVAWLVGALGDRALKGLRAITLGKPEQTSLARALRVACQSLLDQVPPSAREPLAAALEECFRKPPVMILDGRTSVRKALVDGVLAQARPLFDRVGTLSGRSALQELGVDEDLVRAELPEIVVRSVQQVAPHHPTLAPLASQLNADEIQEKIGLILDAVEALGRQSRSPSPGRMTAHVMTRTWTVDLLTPVVDAMAMVPSMADRNTRNSIINSLSPGPRDAIYRSDITRVDILNTVRACENYSGALNELRTTIRLIEGGSEAMRSLDAAILTLEKNDLVRAHLKKKLSP
jgi:Effector-associated domain 2